MSRGAWIFAVCGEAVHTERAAAAAAILRRFTRHRVAILTDPARNRGPVAHDDRIEMAAPAGLTDSQAAIWLKTSVAEALPEGGPHVYLDSDVVAISPEVDRIFEAFVPPLTFASDLPTPESTLRNFSPYAIDCGCAVEIERLERHFERLESLTAMHRAFDELKPLSDAALYERPVFIGERRAGRWWRGEAVGGSRDGSIRFRQRFEEGEPVAIAYGFAGWPWSLEKSGQTDCFRHAAGGTLRFVADASAAGNGYWEDENGDSFRRLRPDGREERWFFRDRVARGRWVADPSRAVGGYWADAAGVELGSCDHLAERLESLFGIAILARDWVPWNGGLFLFDAASRPLLADWRRRCLTLFAEPGFRTRDQGALVATAWATGLAGHPRLAPEWNLLVDRRSPATADLRLAGLRDSGAKLLHFIGGGSDDASWPLASDIAALRKDPLAGE
jgi:hypothetical protein